MMKTMSVKAPQQCNPMPRSQSRPCSDITWNTNDNGFLFKVENTRGVVLMVIYMYVYDPPIRTRTLLLTLGALYVIMHWKKGQRTHVPTDAPVDCSKWKMRTPLMRSCQDYPKQRRRTWWPRWSDHPARLGLRRGPSFDYSWTNALSESYLFDIKHNWMIFNPRWTLADSPTCLWVRK